MAFHWKDGWFFERVQGRKVKPGTVRIFHIPPGDKSKIADVDIEIDPDSWASIIASVSRKGDTGRNFNLALSFHQGAIAGV